MSDIAFVERLEEIIASRIAEKSGDSYTASLAAAGIRRVAQKVGEEAVELALASVSGNREEVIGEAADLVYHVLVLLRVQDIGLKEVATALESRHVV